MTLARTTGFAAAAALALTAAPATAHHGWSTYGDADFELTGTVKEIRLGNPHDILVVEADGQEWEVWLSPPSRSRRAGFDETVIEVGDEVTAFGNRKRDAEIYEMKTRRISVDGEDYALYPNML